MKANRVVFGRKSVEPGLRHVMEQTNKRFFNYFGYETVMVENSETNPETKVKTIFYEQKPLIFCHNIDEFVNEIFHARDLWSTTSIIRLGMDGGQGFVKVSLNIYDKETSFTEPKRFKYEEGVAPQLQKLSSAKRFFFC